jgi:hypothetical protein
MSDSNRLELRAPNGCAKVRNPDVALLSDPNQFAKVTDMDVPAISNTEIGHLVDENEGQFSAVILEPDLANIRSSAAGHPPDVDAHNCVHSSLLMIVERIFRALGISAVGTRPQRVLFLTWNLWFLARAVFLIVEFSTKASSADSEMNVCQLRSTILSLNGTLNKPIQSAIHIVDFVGWMLIFSSSLGGRSLTGHPCSKP